MSSSSDNSWVKPALLAASAAAVTGGIAGYYFYQRAQKAEKDLKAIQSARTVTFKDADKSASAPKKPVRIYIDGVFDLMHYGHANALRQAKAVGDVLIVGIHNDEEVIRNKGVAPVMPEEERYIALSSCKWVDQVIRDAPYSLTKEWVTKLVNEYDVDYFIHGDDPCIAADGTDVYAYAKSIGRYKQVKRTEGVSTTDIVGRMLLMSKDHHAITTPGEGGSRDRAGSVRSSSFTSLTALQKDDDKDSDSNDDTTTPAAPAKSSPHLPVVQSKFLPTARRIMQFADGKVPKSTDRVVYVAGSWDLFNAGHIDALQEARKHGDFLLVGIHDDATVNSRRGHGLPILNLYERTLSLLSCKYVDEVIIGAPWQVTEEMIKTMNISVVVHGTVSDIGNKQGHAALGWSYDDEKVAAALEEENAVPKRMGILKVFESPRVTTALNIIDRIFESRAVFQSRYDKKAKMESEYVKNKEYVEEK